jgi:predicted TIM-barrel fold metal-dependent hydrolase
MKKIDIHCHTTPRRVEGVACEYPNLLEIKRRMQENDIEKTVVLATYFPHKGTGISNFRLQNWINNSSRFEMFGSLDFDHFYYQGMNELEELAQRELMRGIKIYTCYQNVDLKSKKLGSVVGLAEQYKLPMMFHVGYSYCCMSKTGKVAYTEPVSPLDLEFLAKRNPKVNFIFSHMGKPFIEEMINVAKRNSNVYTDSSGLIDFDEKPEDIAIVVDEIKRYLNECGPEKILFGTDFPVQTHEHSVYLIENSMHGFSEKDKEKVYYENARRLLRI